MATYTIRGTSHNVVYTYKAADGKRSSNGNPTLLNLKQFSAKPILTIFNLKTGHLILRMKHPSIVEKKPLKR